MRTYRRDDLPVIGWLRDIKVLAEGFSKFPKDLPPSPEYKVGELVTFSPYQDIKFEIVEIDYILADEVITPEYSVKEAGERYARKFYIREYEIISLNKMKYANR